MISNLILVSQLCFIVNDRNYKWVYIYSCKGLCVSATYDFHKIFVFHIPSNFSGIQFLKAQLNFAVSEFGC